MQPMSPSIETAVDQKLLLALFRVENSEDLEFLEEAIASFLENTPKLLQAMREGVLRPDAVSLQRASHSLKATSANFAAKRLPGLCKLLEAVAKVAVQGETTVPEEAEELVQQIEGEYERVKAELLRLDVKI